ncbi:DUF927 domain-containing protein [Staphylococcus haemolyticus]|uniref:phage NrS-1 polymerase family protein n=1 Tax=Staphylococcus haemolyticus TaxID=1283 RepID=UPI0004466425|nr:DUF927 domain-containing protein [Staphylococcus haemolyticus]EZI38315.1 pathogenicity island protein ORF 14/13 [Staphylococcus haemolyticus]
MAIKEKDKIIEVNTLEIPEELKELPQWVLWRAEWNDKKQEFKKVPYKSGGYKASSTKRDDWSSFDFVYKILENNKLYKGLGFVLSKDDDYIVLDIDNAIDENGQINSDLALEMTELTYCEMSPSGTGLHCFFKGELPEQRKKKRSDLDIELYDKARFMTVTGETIGQSEICEEQEILNNLVERFFKEEQTIETTLTYDPNHKSELSDEEVINLMMKSKQKDKISDLLEGNFEKYFDSPSEAVQSLLHYLAFYTGKDKQQMEQIFLTYNNLTDKWDSKRGNTTWGQLELNKAIANQKEVYKVKKFDDFDVILNDEEKIPDNYVIGDNNWLYKLVEKGKGDNKQVVPKLLTSTPPFIKHKFKDVETGEFYYQLSFTQNKLPYELKVTAREIVDAQHIINLASKGFDVTTSNRTELVEYLAMFMRINNKPVINISTRLGYIGNAFISPYEEDQENNEHQLFNSDKGYQSLIKAFETKGTIEGYINGVFNPIKSKPMVMMMLYSSLGSILLKDFKVDPFVSEISGRTSSGKTFTLLICASVWGTDRLITEWNTTNVSIERMAAFLNTFPIIKDDTRKINNINKLPYIVYQFSGGESKSRANSNRGLDYAETWHNIMLSSGEISIPDLSEKGGLAGRVITLQDEPFPNMDKLAFSDIADAMEENHGLLGKLFIKQYESKKEDYKKAFKSALRYFVEKANNNEVMQRIARSFALLRVAGEILNDIEGFEHDPYVITNQAHTSMLRNNKNIDKPLLLLENVLQYLDANRNNIEGEGYTKVFKGDIKAVHKNDFLCVLGETVKQLLGNELNPIVKQWKERGYLITDKNTYTKRISHEGRKPRGYAIKNEIMNELGFDFTNYDKELEFIDLD